MFDKILSLLKSYAPHLLIILIILVIIAHKLRLMKKVGFYLAGAGACFLVSGIVLVGNPILLLMGNLLFIAGKKTLIL